MTHLLRASLGQYRQSSHWRSGTRTLTAGSCAPLSFCWERLRSYWRNTRWISGVTLTPPDSSGCPLQCMLISSDATCLVKNFGVCETSRRRCGPNTRLRWDWARRFRMIRCHGRVRGVRLGTIRTVLLGGASFVGPVSDEGSRRRQQPPDRGALSVTTTSLATAGEERRADTTIRINEQLRSYITRKCALCSS